MLEKIFSKKEEGKLIHLIYRPSRNKNGFVRENLLDSENFIQCSFLSMPSGKTFHPHKHIYKERSYKNVIAQESWVVIKGSVRCIFYDIDDTVVSTPILYPGDASFTLHGGHTYEIMEEGTLVYEYKTGPYEGQEHDKVFIRDDR